MSGKTLFNTQKCSITLCGELTESTYTEYIYGNYLQNIICAFY